MMKSENRSVRPRSRLPWLLVGLLVLAASSARAGNLDAKESEDLLQARQLYKSGKYQEAADIFSRLSAAHPDMPIFARNAGAAYYYLKKPDPALSNLREYLRVQKKPTADDRQEVDKWIAEMEQLRAQTAPQPPSGGAAVTTPAMPAAAPGAPPLPALPAGPTGLPAPNAPTAAPAYPGYYPYGPAPAQPQPAPSYAAPYGYPAAPAPTAPAADAAAVPPAGQPYGYPYGYAPAPAQPAAPPAVQGGIVQPTQPPEKAKSNLPWIIGGAGVGALALGGVFTYLYRDAFASTEERYNPDQESAGKTYSYLQFVCYGLGAVGVTTAAILLARSEPGAPATTVSVAPALGPQLAGAEIAVRY